MRVFLKEMMFGRPNVIETALVGELDLLKCVLEGDVIGLFVPGTGKLVFVKAAEFHKQTSYSDAGQRQKSGGKLLAEAGVRGA